MKLTSIILILLLPSLFNAQSITQDVISNGGGTYQNINGSMQFNFGEPLTETYTNFSGQIYQGFEQGSYSLVSIHETPNVNNITVELYPNPSNGVFLLNIDADADSFFELQITDGLGKLILQEKSISTLPYQFNLKKHERGVYYLSILNKTDQYIKTYKVIKQ